MSARVYLWAGLGDRVRHGAAGCIGTWARGVGTPATRPRGGPGRGSGRCLRHVR